MFWAAMPGLSVIISNAAGSVTSAVATLTVIDPVITSSRPDRPEPGDSVTFSVWPPELSRSYLWRKDGVAQAGAMQSSLTLTNLQWSDFGQL